MVATHHLRFQVGMLPLASLTSQPSCSTRDSRRDNHMKKNKSDEGIFHGWGRKKRLKF
jgi:hypothetical protein